MPFRRRFAKFPINSIKHIIDTEGTLTGGIGSNTPFVVAVPNVDTATFKPGDVRTGATVNGFFVSVFVIGSTGAPANGAIDWLITKIHSQQIAPTPGQTGTSTIRNQIIHEEKGLAGSGDGTAMVFKGVIAVPKGMRRMREGDQFVLALRSQNQGAVDLAFCIKIIYKSYF